MLSFAQVFAQIFEAIPDNDIVPSLELPPAFLLLYYTFLSVAMVIIVITCRFHE